MKQDKFFEQSSSDALNDFVYSCKEGRGERWDWIVLTAANARQAEAYELQLDRRVQEKWFPIGTRFAVVTDYKGERIGSGGATLNVIRHLCETDGNGIGELDKKILVIHSGGDSKRIPQYSACGKLFAPVPRVLPNGKVSTLFDELLILAAGIPGRVGNGIMIFPSDTQMLFNPLQLDLLSCDAAGLSMKAPVAEGTEHGVFLQSEKTSDDRNRKVARFLHKMPEAILRQAGAVDDKDQVDIDTGCIWLGVNVVHKLRSLFYVDGKYCAEKFEKFVNPDVCLNFYADFVFPLAKEGTLDEFLEETSENGLSDGLKECRKSIWDSLHGFRLSLIKMAPARYIHFGMTRELFDLFVNEIDQYRYLGWKKRANTNATQGTMLNSFVSDDLAINGRVMVEDSVIGKNVAVGDQAVLSNVEVSGCTIPGETVLSGVQLKDGRCVCRIYGIEDNPKASADAAFLGESLNKLVKIAGVSKKEIWGNHPASIWNASIYPVMDTMEQAVQESLVLYKILKGEGSGAEIERWKRAEKFSLGDSFKEADVPAMLINKAKIRHTVKLRIFLGNICSGSEMNAEMDALCADCTEEEITAFVDSIYHRAASEAFPNCMRMYFAASDICKNYQKIRLADARKYEDAAYEAMKKCIIQETFTRYRFDTSNRKIVAKKAEISLPVRVNFCGSPSDAAPYCLEHGGSMVDGTLLLKGKKPVKVIAEKIETGFAFCSIDQNVSVSIDDLKEIQNCGDLSDPFALHKAVLVAAGLVPFKDEIDMHTFCGSIGGGIRLTTVADVPKGSGLGTSSIIAAAAIRAVNHLFGVEPSDEMIYAQVFLAEQLMNTGGGWQDQVGGLTSGIKYFTTQPGLCQKIDVDILDLAEDTMSELNERFALIFSGQRRLARNVLRAEMNQCIRNDRKSLDAIQKIQEYCAIMRHYLRKGNITEFAHYITRQFELVKILDKGASNTCIEYIFDVIDDLIDGKSICGAGGGGFLQVILKKGVSKRQLSKRITDAFADCGVEMWDCELI